MNKNENIQLPQVSGDGLGRADLNYDLKGAVGMESNTDEELTQALFELFHRATKHTIAWIIKKHSALVIELMSKEYAQMLDD